MPMKKLILIVLFLASFNNAFSQSQNSNGVYLTSSEFLAAKIHLKGDRKHVKICADLIFKPMYVRVKTEGKKYYFHKDSIWGISDNKHIYRFLNSNSYMVIANSGIILYSQRDHGRHMRLYYYFSETASSPVLLLTVKNLEKSFRENKKFHELMNNLNLKTNDLAFYDKNSKTYRIISVYNQSLEK
jgi:hypothetical protein